MITLPHRKLFCLVSLLAAGILLLLNACAPKPEGGNKPTPQPRTATPIPTIRATSTPIATQPPSPDLTGETLTIHVIASSEEPFSPLYEVVRAGLEDYAAFRSAHGGVNGAELNLQFAEVDSSGAGALGAYQLFSSQAATNIILVLAPINQDLYDAINAADIPVIYFGTGAQKLDLAAEDDHLFWLVPRPDQQLAFWLDYAVKNWPDLRPEGQFDVMRLNYISWGSTLGGFERVVGMRDHLQEINIQLANEGRVTPVSNASAANAILDGVFTQSTMLYLDLYSHGTAAVLNDLHYLDLGGFFNIAGGSWAIGIDLLPYMPFPDQVEALYTPLPIAWWSEAENPGIQAAESIFEFAGRTAEEKELGYLYALCAADLAVSALETALSEYNKASEVELTPDGVYQALSKMADFAILDGLMNVNFNDGIRTPQQLRIWSYTFGILSPASDFLPQVELE